MPRCVTSPPVFLDYYSQIYSNVVYVLSVSTVNLTVLKFSPFGIFKVSLNSS
jgi:hypothetical protein